MGGHLATINDAAEGQWVFGAFAGYGGEEMNLWIGLNDVAQEGTFVWVSGEASTYRNWHPADPNDFGPGGEDYGHILRPSFGPALWNDAPDTAFLASVDNIGALYGVVEVNPVPEPASLAALLRRRRGASSP